QGFVGCVLDQRMLEGVARIGRRTGAEQQLRLFELHQCRAQRRLVAAGDRAQQRVGDFPADRGAALSELLYRRQPGETARQWTLRCRRDARRGPSKRQRCGPATSKPASSTVLDNSSTKGGTPSVLVTICAVTSEGSGRPATCSARVSTSAGGRRSSAMLVTCERPVQGAS